MYSHNPYRIIRKQFLSTEFETISVAKILFAKKLDDQVIHDNVQLWMAIIREVVFCCISSHASLYQLQNDLPESEFKNLTDDPKIHKVNITAVGEIKKSFERVQTEAVQDEGT